MKEVFGNSNRPKIDVLKSHFVQEGRIDNDVGFCFKAACMLVFGAELLGVGQLVIETTQGWDSSFMGWQVRIASQCNQVINAFKKCYVSRRARVYNLVHVADTTSSPTLPIYVFCIALMVELHV